MQKSTAVFVWVLALALGGCVNPPGQLTWQDILFRDGPKTLEECLANVDHHFDDRVVVSNFGRVVGRVRDMPFSGFFREMQYDHCHNNFEATPPGITIAKTSQPADAGTVFGSRDRNPDPFGLAQEPRGFKGGPRPTGDLVNLLPKPAKKKSSQEIYEERLQEYLDSPLRGGASAAVRGFDYRAVGCPAGDVPRLGC